MAIVGTSINFLDYANMLTSNLSLNYLRYLFIALIVTRSTATSPTGNSTNIKTVIGHRGHNVSIECKSCNNQPLYWTYKLPTGEDKDITEGLHLVRKEMYPLNEMQYNLAQQNCSYNLLLQEVKFSAAGLFICWDGSTEKSKTNFIVVDHEKNCSITPDVTHATPGLLNQTIAYEKNNSHFTINCELHYSTEGSCVVSPIWIDTTKSRNITASGNGFEVKLENKIAQLVLRPDADIEDGTHFKISIAFNCSSFSNNSHDLRQQETYNFGEVPFTFSVKREEENVDTGSTMLNTYDVTTSESIKETTLILNKALINGLPVLTVIVVAALVIFCLKKYSKLCFAAKNARRMISQASVMGKALPEIPMTDGYAGFTTDFQSKYAQNYEVLDDGTYDAIDDPELKESGNYIPIIY